MKDYIDKKRVVAKLQDEYYFMIGEIVEWGKSLWIISEIHITNEGIKGLDLIDLNHSNTSAHPSLTWPSKEKGIKSVKVLASCMKDFFKDKIEHLFQWG